MSKKKEKRQNIIPETSESEDNDLTEENILRIIVASDINLGYEQTTKRDQAEDSFITFEEILQFAKDYDADCILLGGNLFYEANPPLHVVQRCISLLRKYCLREKPVTIDCVSDPEEVFNHCDHKVVNFKDPNLNIGIPIFSIYGNRDKPIFSRVGPLDLLATTGLINYFGKWTSDHDSKINVLPLLLRKGTTDLALHGLNHMNEGKLTKLFKDKKLEFSIDESATEVCNLLVLNQKRARPCRPENSFLSESVIPDIFNIIIWGGEPECRIVHQTVPDKLFRISQPGGCIATSLSRGDMRSKKVALMQVYKSSFKMNYLKLKTIRPFAFARLDLSEYDEEISNLQKEIVLGRIVKKSRAQAIEKFTDKQFEQLILPTALKRRTGHPRQPQKPLLRLKIFYEEDSDRFDPHRLARKYKDQVANPNDMIVFINRSLLINYQSDDDNDELYDILFKDESKNWTRTVERGISEYFSREENRKKMKVLPFENLNKALNDFKNDDYQAFYRTVQKNMQKRINYLMKNDVEVEDALEALEHYNK